MNPVNLMASQQFIIFGLVSFIHTQYFHTGPWVIYHDLTFSDLPVAQEEC